MKTLLHILATLLLAPLSNAIGQATPTSVSADHLKVPDDLEVTLWATSPTLFNPTNIDTDAAGRIWVAEGVNYRKHVTRRAEGDRIMVLEDTDGDGKADKALVWPLGVSVFDNKIVIAHGFGFTHVELKDEGQIDGITRSIGDPVMLDSMGGITQLIPRDRIKSIKVAKNRSLMLSADKLGLTAQNVADLAACLLKL